MADYGGGLSVCIHPTGLTYDPKCWDRLLYPITRVTFRGGRNLQMDPDNKTSDVRPWLGAKAPGWTRLLRLGLGF